MKCSNAKEKLALFAGGDLPEPGVAELLTHINDCPTCAHELDQLQRAKAAIETISMADLPDPLPEGLAAEIHQMAAKTEFSGSDKDALKWSWRPVVIFGGIAAVLLIAIGLTGIMRENRIQAIMEWQREWIQTAGENRTCRKMSKKRMRVRTAPALFVMTGVYDC